MKSISIDIGNGYLKVVNQEGQTLHFPTVIKENLDTNILGQSRNEYSIVINSSSYYIGNLAIAKKGTRQWQSNKTINVDTPLYAALCCHLLTEEDNPEINLCLGLPYNYYIALHRGERITKELTGKEIETIYKDKKKKIKINHVSVYPQGVGAYFSSLYDINGKPIEGAENRIKALFIDIGYRTIDVVAFESLNNTFELIEENSFSLEEYGMFNAINDIVSNTREQELNHNDVEYAIQNNNGIIESMYGDIDLKEVEKIAYEKLATRITNTINIKLSGEIQRYKHIYLTGGGATKLFPYIKKIYPNIKLQDDPIFCNAKGYLALENTK